MADLIFRGVKIPANCSECSFWSICPCLAEFDDYTAILDAVHDGNLVRHEKCPVSPIPEGHGRLIDAERFRVILCRLKERQNDDVATHALNWAIECLDKMDTIVPAEGGTDECSEN